MFKLSFYLEIIIDSHPVLRKDSESSLTLRLSFFQRSTSQKLWRNITARIVTLIQSRSRDFHHCKDSGYICIATATHLLPQPLLEPLAAPNLFPISTILLFQENYINRITQCIIFGDWIVSLNMFLRRFTQIVVCVNISISHLLLFLLLLLLLLQIESL